MNRGVVPFKLNAIGGFIVNSPGDAAGQAVRWPVGHKIVDATVVDGELLLLMEGEQMPAVADDGDDQAPRMRCVVRFGYPVCEFKPEV